MAAPPSARREALTQAALDLLETEGPDAVSTRKVAARVGASTMVVYTEFGSLPGLVSSVIDEGFGRLSSALTELPATDDPIADLRAVGHAYRAFAKAHPDLYRVIYAVSPLAGHRQAGEELLQGVAAFEVLHAVVRRAYDAGQLTVGTPYAAALQLWTAWHGLVLIDLAGYLDALPAALESEEWFSPLLTGLGYEDARER